MIWERIHLHRVVTCSPTDSVMRLTPAIFLSFSGIFTNPSGWHHLLRSCVAKQTTARHKASRSKGSAVTLSSQRTCREKCAKYTPHHHHHHHNHHLAQPTTSLPHYFCPSWKLGYIILGVHFSAMPMKLPLATISGLGVEGWGLWWRKKNSGSIKA